MVPSTPVKVGLKVCPMVKATVPPFPVAPPPAGVTASWEWATQRDAIRHEDKINFLMVFIGFWLIGSVPGGTLALI
jgi:hypothetical protein